MEITQPIRLTQTVQKGGCAAKVAAKELRAILGAVKFPPTPSELTVDSGSFDDAAIYTVSPELALVQTLDFFTPIVDSPRLFGRIAAANSLSDVYAMGGKPKTAMAILAFPLGTLDNEVITEVLQGASDVIAESGAALVGGHSIDDDTLKFGLSVTGFVHPERVWANAGAKPGDVLILTKALGTGALTAALKRGEVDEDGIRDGLESMAQLNNAGCFIPMNHLASVHAATDITGFGLAGHAFNMARASKVTFQIQTRALPRFERALELIEKGFLTKAHRTNAEYVKGFVSFEGVEAAYQQLVFDPQTSGGLLLSVAPESADEVLSALRAHFPRTEKIGTVAAAGSSLIQFT